MANSLELSTFQTCVGDRFRLEFVDGPTIDLTLVDASAAPSHRPEGDQGRAPFRLEFSGPPAPVLPQRTYEMSHETLGKLAIFVGPVEVTAEATTYEAIFS